MTNYPTAKILVVSKNDTKCNQVLIYKDRLESGETGISIQAWHCVDGFDLIQRQFTEMRDTLIGCFIQDFSEQSAQNFIESFEK